MDILTQTYIKLREKLTARTGAMLSSREDAEDVLQETFYKLWSKHYSYGNSREAEAIFAATAKNTGIDKLRRSKPTVPLDGHDKADTPTGDSREKLKIVENIIERELTDTQKYIIRRKEYEGAPMHKIAAELKMEESAVRMQLSRARKKIRELYNKTEDE